jgi:hypothetical protein
LRGFWGFLYVDYGSYFLEVGCGKFYGWVGLWYLGVMCMIVGVCYKVVYMCLGSLWCRIGMML